MSEEKSESAFRSISEVAGSLNVETHVLRFWETKFDIIQPLKRAAGRRFYRPEDVQVIAGIQCLLHEDGLTIKACKKLSKTTVPTMYARAKEPVLCRARGGADQTAARPIVCRP